MKRTVSFTFDYDPADRSWTVTSADGPGAYGVHEEPYEALMECAFGFFEYVDEPMKAPRGSEILFHQLNLDFCPHTEDNEPVAEEEERVLSPLQQERARLFAEALREQ